MSVELYIAAAVDSDSIICGRLFFLAWDTAAAGMSGIVSEQTDQCTAENLQLKAA